MRAPEDPRRQVDVAGGDAVRDFVDPDGPRRQRFGVELDPHSVLGGAIHVDLRDARDRGQALRDEGLGVFVQVRERERVRAHRVVDDRLVGRVHFLVRGWHDAGGELTQRFGNRRLDVLCGGIDAAVQRELEGDVGVAQAGRGGHLIHARDRGELLFERCRYGGRHGLGTRAWEARVDLDGGEVDVREIAHRQQPVRHQPEGQDPQHDERRHDRPPDEQRGDVHLSPSIARAGSAEPFTSTGAPFTSRTWPSVTTSSPGRTPCAITA